VVHELVLPNNRDVYTVKKYSDLPWAELGILSVPGVGMEASAMFYYNKTLVFDPTGISGDIAAVKKNVRETLEWLETILEYFQVNSVTVILNGNIWQYFEELEPFARLVYNKHSTFYVNMRSYNADLDLEGTPTPRNRVNVIIHEGNTGEKFALLAALHWGRKARQNNYSMHRLRLFIEQENRQLRRVSHIS